MESFATPYQIFFTDGEKDHDKGVIGIHSVLTFKRFQALISQKIGLSPSQLSAVFVCRRVAGDGDKRQKLPITESTNFNIILNQHNPSREKDCYFLVALKKSKKDRKVSRKKNIDAESVESEDAYSTKSGPGSPELKSRISSVNIDIIDANESIGSSPFPSPSPSPSPLSILRAPVGRLPLTNYIGNQAGVMKENPDVEELAAGILLSERDSGISKEDADNYKHMTSIETRNDTGGEHSDNQFLFENEELESHVDEASSGRPSSEESVPLHKPEPARPPMPSSNAWSGIAGSGNRSTAHSLVGASPSLPVGSPVSRSASPIVPASLQISSRVSIGSPLLQPGMSIPGKEITQVGNSTNGSIHQSQQQPYLSPEELSNLSGMLRGLAAGTSLSMRSNGDIKKICKFCSFCKERNLGSPPFHWCVDDRVVVGFRGPSPAGPIGRPIKRHIEAVA